MFLSHTWKADDEGRDTHRRVGAVHDALVAQGHTTWFDEDVGMAHDLDGCMAEGIEQCDTFVVFVTREYCVKVERAARDPNRRDNCYKEVSYAACLQKAFLPVVFEPSILDDWPSGIVKMHCANKMFVDGSVGSAVDTAGEIARLSDRLRRRSRSELVGAERKARVALPPIAARAAGGAVDGNRVDGGRAPLPPIATRAAGGGAASKPRASSAARRRRASPFRLPSILRCY